MTALPPIYMQLLTVGSRTKYPTELIQTIFDLFWRRPELRSDEGREFDLPVVLVLDREAVVVAALGTNLAVVVDICSVRPGDNKREEHVSNASRVAGEPTSQPHRICTTSAAKRPPVTNATRY